jgi:3',5'-cyclic AMP phosphodiesterase CpdA
MSRPIRTYIFTKKHKSQTYINQLWDFLCIFAEEMKQIIITVCMMLLTMSISAKTLVVADKKIVVLSDPHVMAPELLVSEGEAWTNYLSGQRKMVDYSQALFDEMVAKIKDEIKPNLVLITGDLTKDGEQLSHTYVISNHDHIRKALIDAGIKVIFTGHFHTSDIAKDFNDELTAEIYDVNTGSLISYPCDYREVTISGDLSELSLTTGHITSLSGDETFTSEYAMSRLHDSVKKAVAAKITAKITAKFGATFAASMTSVIEIMADNVAKAFIIHAEGNEADVDTKDIMTALKPVFNFVPGTEAMCKSMLEDKAPYGEEGRENVTDDLSLTVKMVSSFLPGDANGDGVVNVADIVEIINFMNENASEHFNKKAADVTAEGDVDDDDINAIIAIITCQE